MALTLGRSKLMTELSFDQLAYLAAKAKLPEKLVLDAAKETVVQFMGVWQSREFQNTSPKVVEPIKALLGRIPIVDEVSAMK